MNHIFIIYIWIGFYGLYHICGTFHAPQTSNLWSVKKLFFLRASTLLKKRKQCLFYCSIRSVYPNHRRYCLGHPGGGGMYAYNLECGHRQYHQWEIILQQDGTSRIKNLQTNTCLAPFGANNQTQYNCADNDPSLNWILAPVDSPGNKE